MAAKLETREYPDRAEAVTPDLTPGAAAGIAATAHGIDAMDEKTLAVVVAAAVVVVAAAAAAAAAAEDVRTDVEVTAVGDDAGDDDEPAAGVGLPCALP